MSAIITYNKTIKLIKLNLRYGMWNILDEDWKFDYLPITNTIDVILFLFINAYSSYTLYGGDYINFANSIVGFGLGGEGCSIIIVYLFNRKDLLELCKATGIFYECKNDKPDSAVSYMLDEYARINLKACKIFSILWYSACIISLLYPLIWYAKTGERILAFGFFLPGIPYTDLVGYTINMSFQCLQVYLVAFSLNSHEMFFITFMVSVISQVDMLKIKLSELSSFIENGKATFDGNFYTDIKQRVNEIVQLHQSHKQFMNQFIKVYTSNLLLLIFSKCYQVSIALYVCTSVIWFPGYSMMVMATLQLLIKCTFGSIIITKHQELIAAIYNIEWFNLPLKFQKDITFLLMVAQKQESVTCGFLVPLDLHTFLEVYKKIGSYFMMLKSFDE